MLWGWAITITLLFISAFGMHHDKEWWSWPLEITLFPGGVAGILSTGCTIHWFAERNK